ncbi:molybdenum cofactor guanylyltransferase [Candidatus Spongiisocius sp.]|uniref:molybdenum cofactor guanylyltransferase n=1 Tax=Candidatus Spongiisocius sp. TaxID=3101273 RepID=UPI003B5BD500
MRGVVGVILAGGESRRMGSDKALVEVGGRPMAGWVADAMAGFDRVVMVGRRRGAAGLEAIPDLQPGPAGPLNGLQTALAVFRQPVVAVAVDQPLVRSGTLDCLAERAAANQTAVCIDERPQVTCAAYSPDCLDEADRVLRSGGSIQQMLRSVPWTRLEREVWSSWGEDGRSWFSMDSPDAIVAAERRFRINLLG